MNCRRCGCSALRACRDAETGECCHWVDQGLCSFCDEELAWMADLIWSTFYEDDGMELGVGF